jgi:hypothetical protein
MRVNTTRRTRRRPASLWLFKAVNGLGIVLVGASLLAVAGSIALELYTNLVEK